MQNKIIRLWDYTSPNNWIPNGLNYNFLNIYLENDFNEYVPEKFLKTYQQVSVYDCHLNTAPHIFNDCAVSDFYNNDQLTLYTVTPFGNLLTGLGEDFSWHLDKTFFDFVSNVSIKLINEKDNVFLYFDYSTEGDVREQAFEAIYKGIKKVGINPNKVIFVSSAINLSEIHEKYLEENTEDVQIKVGLNPWAFLGKSREIARILEGNDYSFKGKNSTYLKTEDIDFKSKRKVKFNYLNRRLRPHRLVLLSLLESEKLIEDNYVSYDLDLSFHGKDRNFYEIITQERTIKNKPLLSDRNYLGSCLKGYRRLNKRYKKTIDFDDINSVWGFGYESPWIYNESYFTVVSETLFYERGVYMSEKTFKPIAHCHPFVIVSKEGTLKYLKELGFKSFDDLWDESYDSIEDDSERIVAVFELIRELSNKSDDEWIDIYEKIKDRLIFNREHLLSISQREDITGDIFINNLNKIAYESNQENYSLLQGIEKETR